jgi:hypothetical protein
LLVGITLIVALGISVMILAPADLSDHAVATLAVAAIGVLGTHVGHVSGHSLGRASRRGGVSHVPKEAPEMGDSDIDDDDDVDSG